MNDQRTIYCGNRHRTLDGVPVGHSCRVLAPEYLEAERLEEYGRAASVLERMPLILHLGVTEHDDVAQRGGHCRLARDEVAPTPAGADLAS